MFGHRSARVNVSRHPPPYGRYCKFTMAVVDGYDRKDPKYLTFLEDSFTRQHAEQDRLQDELEGWKRSSGGSKPGAETSVHDRDILAILDNISKRLDNLEVSSAEQPTASAPARQASATSQPTASTLQASATSQPTALATGPAIATPPAPADLLTGPLTQALARLSGVAADDSKGKPYRPETYSQKTDKKRDYSKMDLVDLVYGWTRVAEHIASTGGNIGSYIQHMKFTAELLHSRKFFDESAVSYDRHIIDSFVDGKSSDFNPDPIGASLCFSPNVIPKDCEPVHGGSLHKSVIGAHDNQRRFRFRRGGRAAYSNRPRSEEKPADSDPDVCLFYNYKTCYKDSCDKPHICRRCKGSHRADNCKSEATGKRH